MSTTENQTHLDSAEVKKIRHNLANIALALDCSIVNFDKKYVTPDIAELLIQYHVDENVEEPHKMLSDREMEVFILVAKGKKITDIAEELSLSVNTISTYRSRILEKMHMGSNAEIAKYAIRHGFE